VALVVLEADTMEGLFLVEASVALALLRATNAEVQTTLHETVSEILAHLVDYIMLTPILGQAQAMKCYACGKLGHISRELFLWGTLEI
jgi:hypothetical protein